jgi:hypothetical protein
VYTLKEVLLKYKEFWKFIFSKKIAMGTIDPENPLPFIKGTSNKILHQYDPEWNEKQFKEIMKKSKLFKSPGPHTIPTELITLAPEGIQNIWKQLFKYSWEYRWIPKKWRESYIVLLKKDESYTQYLTYYRPISLDNTDKKIYTNIIYHKLEEYCHKNNILKQTQFGSIKQKSAAQAAITAKLIMDDARIHNKQIHTLYLDLAKAYDSVPHELIKRTLMYYKIPKREIIRIMEIYKDNKAIIYTPHGKTESIPIKNGVKQGDTLSPLLFILVINVLLESLENTNAGYTFHKNKNLHIPCISYVDDLTLFTDSPEKLRTLTNIVQNFCKETGMRLNPQKCTYVTNSTQARPITINNVPIKPNNEDKACRLLGVKLTISGTQKLQESQSVAIFNKSVNGIVKKSLYTTQRVQIINLLFSPQYHTK